MRLKGLHCPERNDPGGYAATSLMAVLVSGQSVRSTLTGEQTYDREVGACYVGDKDLTVALMRGGVRARYARYDIRMRYVPAQWEAGEWPAVDANVLSVADSEGIAWGNATCAIC